jgi:hypothetical protein
MLAVYLHIRLQIRDTLVGREFRLGDQDCAFMCGSPVFLSASIPGFSISLDMRVSLWRATSAARPAPRDQRRATSAARPARATSAA